MPGDELLGVLDTDGRTGFEIEDDFMLRAMELKDAPDVFGARDEEKEADENRQTNEAIDGVEGDLAFQRGLPVA